MAKATEDPAYCPKSDEGVKSAVKPGALVVGLGKAGQKVAGLLRAELGKSRVPTESDNWEETKINHLIVVVECNPMNGDCCEAASKFMRQVRASDGYGVYSDIIGRKVGVLALGKMGKVSGASKVMDVLTKRGGCKPLLPKVGRADADTGSVANLDFVKDVRKAFDTLYPPPPAERPCCEAKQEPAAPQQSTPSSVVPPPTAPTAPAHDSKRSLTTLLVIAAAAAVLIGVTRRLR